MGGVDLKQYEPNKIIELSAGPGESSGGVKVTLFGREYNIRGHGNTKYVQKLATFITERAEDIKRSAAGAASSDLVILTLLNITDEMFQHKHANEETIKKLEEKTDRLLKAIDRLV
ncbi:MAG TPA: cell division protein ZapA [Desulfomonilaceae bacterium]|nr:cell division protein ZapA [Desulfomonilaceae bacterium]